MAKLQATSSKPQAAEGRAQLVVVLYSLRQPQPPSKGIGFYRICKDTLCPEWVDQNERKHVDVDPDLGYYRIISPLPCRAIQNLNRA